MLLVVSSFGCMQDLHWSKKEKSQDLLRIHIPCISCEPSLNWSLVLDKLRMEFTEMTQLGSFSTLLTRLAELWFEAESV